MNSLGLRFAATALLLLATASCSGNDSAGHLRVEPLMAPADMSLNLAREASPELRQLLTETLEKELQQRGHRSAGTAPLHESSRVTDLRLAEPAAGQLSFAWSLRLAGDYDANGIVNAADLVPLGQHFGLTWDHESWGLIAQLDGDGNGEIGLGDIVPIAQNFQVRCSGFLLQGSQTEAAASGWTLIEDIDAGTVAVDQYTLRRGFSLHLAALGYKYYRLLPYAAAASGAREDGLPSNIAVNFAGLSTASGWYTSGGSNLRQSLAQSAGPAELALLWHSESFPQEIHGSLQSPVIGQDGTAYTADAGGFVAAFNPDGSLKWQIELYTTGALQGFMLTADGTLIIKARHYQNDQLIWVSATGDEIRRVSFDEKVSLPAELPDGSLCLAGESSVIMLDGEGAETERLDIEGEEAKPHPPLVTSEGLICIGGLAYGGVGEGDGLLLLNPSLEVLWTVPLLSEMLAAPAQTPDGRLCIAVRGSVCCLDISGAEIWRYEAGVKGAVAVTAENQVVVPIHRNSTEEEGYSLVRLEADGGEGWKFWLGEEYGAGEPVCDQQGRVFFADKDTKLHCLAADGTELWSFKLDPANSQPRNTAQPALTDDGRLLIAFGERLHCIGEGGSGIVPAPQGFKVQAMKDHFHMSWDPVEGAEGYLIYRHLGQEQRLLARLEGELEYSDYSVVSEFSASYSVSAYGFLGEGPQNPGSGEKVPEFHIQNGGAGDWAVQGRDSSRTYRSGVRGPSAPNELWRVMPDEEGSFGPVVCSRGGFVYCADAGGKLCCINHLGTYAWRYGPGISAAPALMADGRIVVSCTSSVTRLDGEHLVNHYVECLSPSRQLAWRREVPAASHVMLVRDGRVALTNEEYGLCLLDSAGQMLWCTEELAVHTYGHLQLVSPPSVSADGRISVCFFHTILRPDYWRFDLAGNTVLQLEHEPGHMSSIHGYSIRPDGSLLGALSGQAVFSFGADARMDWYWPDLSGGLAVLSNGSTLASFSDQPSLRRMDRQGHADWRTVLPAVPSSTLAADASGAVFVGLESGEVLKLGSDGEIEWTLDLAAGSVNSLAIGDDGRLFVSAGEALVALGDS